MEKCKYCGHRFIPLVETKRELKYCECGCPVPLTNGRGYCVNCKEEVFGSALFSTFLLIYGYSLNQGKRDCHKCNGFRYLSQNVNLHLNM